MWEGRDGDEVVPSRSNSWIFTLALLSLKAATDIGLRDVNGEEDTAAMKIIACERRREQRRVMQQVSELGGWKESTKTKQ